MNNKVHPHPFWGSVIVISISQKYTGLTGDRLASISVKFHSVRDKLGLKTCWDKNTVRALKGVMVCDPPALPCLKLQTKAPVLTCGTAGLGSGHLC